MFENEKGGVYHIQQIKGLINNIQNTKNNNKTYSIMKKFISQTQADDNGDYTITYIDYNNVLITKNMNLFD